WLQRRRLASGRRVLQDGLRGGAHPTATAPAGDRRCVGFSPPPSDRPSETAHGSAGDGRATASNRRRCTPLRTARATANPPPLPCPCAAAARRSSPRAAPAGTAPRDTGPPTRPLPRWR